MIVGIGTDIIEIERISRAVAKERFVRKIYTIREEEYLKYKGVKSFAGCFAAKEAVSKALGVGFSGFAPVDVEILHNAAGQPFVLLHNGAAAIAQAINVSRLHLTISHCKEQAVAFCVAESGAAAYSAADG